MAPSSDEAEARSIDVSVYTLAFTPKARGTIIIYDSVTDVLYVFCNWGKAISVSLDHLCVELFLDLTDLPKM